VDPMAKSTPSAADVAKTEMARWDD
jgi:hypothetical protein